MDFIIFALSMGALTYGANFVINESERIAHHFNISPFVIGATLVALGTSLPEMAASMAASLSGKSDLAVSNVVGSTIFNIALVLGIVFIIARGIVPKRDLFARDSSWALFPILVFIIMGFDGVINKFEGVLFLVMMVAYVLFLATDAKELTTEVNEELKSEPYDWKKTVILLLIGFIFVIVGAHYTIESASSIARSFGVSEWVIGLLLVAFGTSLPELVISIAGALKKNSEMVIGNIIGSNVANFTIVLGSAAILNPLNVDFKTNMFDIMAALIVTIMLVFITANKLYNKSAGIVLLVVMALVLENSLG